jgi:hypothetical protein
MLFRILDSNWQNACPLLIFKVLTAKTSEGLFRDEPMWGKDKNRSLKRWQQIQTTRKRDVLTAAQMRNNLPVKQKKKKHTSRKPILRGICYGRDGREVIPVTMTWNKNHITSHPHGRINLFSQRTSLYILSIPLFNSITTSTKSTVTPNITLKFQCDSSRCATVTNHFFSLSQFKVESYLLVPFLFACNSQNNA